MTRRMGMVLVLLSLGLLGLFVAKTPAIAVRAQSVAAPRVAPDRTKYVGDASCMRCHQEQALGYERTSHHLTSQLSDRKNVLGSFAPGSHTLTISSPSATADDPRLYFTMDARPDGLYQTAVAELGDKRLTRTERFDITVGSGVRGQTYLYWSGDQLFELPVSYWTDGHRWINSPGYKDGTANFARHVDPRCMECHATFIRALSDDPQTNVYDRASLVPGIGCESCHGPGADHVALETDRTTMHTVAATKAILNPARFIRDRQVDQCALCHNGIAREERVPAFSYTPGEPLDRYLAPNPLDAVDHPDVHGNQVGLLKRSRCYVGSPAMSCSTCHNVHAPEQTPASYSGRCLSCHRWQSCGASKVIGEKVKSNCIDCHMPVQETAAIVSVTAGSEVRGRIRTHWIKVYPATAPQTN